MNALQAAFGQHMGQHFDSIVLQDADVVQLVLTNALEQSAHAGFMHLAA